MRFLKEKQGIETNRTLIKRPAFDKEFGMILSVLKEESVFVAKAGIIQSFNVKQFSEWVQKHITL